MTERALAVLVLLEKQELDRRRRALAAEEAVREHLDMRRSASISAQQEIISSTSKPGDGLALDIAGRLVEAHRGESHRLQLARDMQAERCSEHQDLVAQSLLAYKRLALVAERRSKAERSRAEAREQAAMEEVAIQRHARRARAS